MIRSESSAKSCTRCGKGKHSRDKCPARDVACYKCHQRGGHYGSMRLSKRAADTEELQEHPTWPIGGSDEEEEDNNFLGAVTTQQQTQWLTQFSVNDLPVTFKIDTGAEVSAISEATFNQLCNVTIRKTTKRLYGPAMSPLTVLGQFTAILTSRHVSCK